MMDKITPKIDFKNELVNPFDLKGQVILVAGAYGGIGEAVSWGLALSGAQVIIAGRDKIKADRLSNDLGNANLLATAQQMDVGKVENIRQVVDDLAKQFGRIDSLVNCVGIQKEEPLLEVTEAAFDEVISVNLKSAMFLGQAVARHQVKNGSGRQVHLLSVRAQLGLRDRGYSAYCSSKGGLVMLIKQHAMELARHGITVNGVAPTFVYTEMIRHVMENPEFRKNLLDRIPLGRIGDPKNVAGPVQFFCSPASSFVAGQIMYVDGGITASQ